MSKERDSKLDPFAKQLDQWLTSKDKGGDGMTFKQACKQLALDGCSAAPSTLFKWWESRVKEMEREDVLGQIMQAANQAQKVEKQFAENPAPELEMLIKLHRVAILELRTEGNKKPELLKLADQLTNTVLQCLSAQTKAHFKEREVTLAEQKALEAKKTDQQKALEFCLEEAKDFPQVLPLFRQAFDALAKAKQPTA